MTKKKYNPAYPAELRARGVRLFQEQRSNYTSDTAGESHEFHGARI